MEANRRERHHLCRALDQAQTTGAPETTLASFRRQYAALLAAENKLRHADSRRDGTALDALARYHSMSAPAPLEHLKIFRELSSQ